MLSNFATGYEQRNMIAMLYVAYPFSSYSHIGFVIALLLSISWLSLQGVVEDTQVIKDSLSHQTTLTAIQMAKFALIPSLVGLAMLFDSPLLISLWKGQQHVGKGNNKLRYLTTAVGNLLCEMETQYLAPFP